MTNFEKLKQLVESSQEDFQKFYDKGVNSAGSRIRKAMQELKALAQEIRVDVQDKKNAGKSNA